MLGTPHYYTVRCWTPMPAEVVPHDYPRAFCDEHAALARQCLQMYDQERDRQRAIAKHFRKIYGRRN